MSEPTASSSDSSAEPAAELNALAGTWVVPGRKVVVGMVLFGASMIGALYLYWELYTRPFRPLQAAIAAEFPGSSPRAVGGKPKSHLPQSPAILRVIVRVAWNPRDDESRARETANRLTEICSEHLTLADYDRMEIVLMHRRPEQWTISWWCEAPVTAFPLATAGPPGENVKLRVVEGVEGS